MDASPQDPLLVAMDLSKTYSPLSRGPPETVDLSKKPEWYRRPPGCGPDVSSAFRSRASGSYGSTAPPVHRRDVEQGPESLGTYMNSGLAPGLDLFHDPVHGGLWHAGFCGTDQSGDESDSGSDVIFLVSSSKEPLLCGSFIQDGVGHVVEPLSPAVSSAVSPAVSSAVSPAVSSAVSPAVSSPDEGTGCYLVPRPLSSPSPDSSSSEDSSDSSVDIPVHHTRPVVLLSDLKEVYRTRAGSDLSSANSDPVQVPVPDQRKTTPPRSESDKSSRRKVRRNSRRRSTPKPTRFCEAPRRRLKRRVKNDAVGIYNENCDSDDLMALAERFSSSEEPVLPHTDRTGSEESDRVTRTDRKSPLRERRACKALRPGTENALPSTLSRTKQNRVHRTAPQQSERVHRTTPQQHKPKAVRRRRKRFRSSGPSARFPPTEPKILLKYLRTKEQRKEKKPDRFCPFVHMEQRVCRVVNYQDEESIVQNRRGPQRRTLCGSVPFTSCFQLGRACSGAGSPAELRCCLCGRTANVLGLGDLHGPYCPTTGTTCRTEPEDFQKPSNGCLQNSSEDDEKNVLRTDGLCPPEGGPLLDEYWIHEDCSIWADGVFLVRGKLYGLEEAARLAQETVCSSCHQKGAMMGCFQKGCCRNYHSSCAAHSGCVLNEDNFTMRCPEHKNKVWPTTSRQNKR